jgi:hypothetical protein
MNWRACGRKVIRRKLATSGICLKESKKLYGQYGQSPGPDLTPGPPLEYKVKILNHSTVTLGVHAVADAGHVEGKINSDMQCASSLISLK